MNTKRDPSAAEVETLQAVLTKSLGEAYPQDMKDVAVSCARSVKAAFDELYKADLAPESNG